MDASDTHSVSAGHLARDRDASLDSLRLLEDALSAPTPSREDRWLLDVVAALDRLIDALETQAATDAGTGSLLSEIAVAEPRLLPRIERLRREHADLRAMARSLRDQIAPTDGLAVDTSDIRERLGALGQRLRHHRAREADLIFEAIDVDLGVGD